MAHLVWDALGDVPNFVEPFFGSGAVLLARPHRPRTETVNDINCYLSCFWRALARDPDAVALHADWPVNEVDLHARHRWLVNQAEFRERMRRDPEFYDARVAGWWVWGISMWIGGGWCATPEDAIGERPSEQEKRPRRDAGAGVVKRLPCDSPRVPLDQGHAGVTKRRGVEARGRDDGPPEQMPQVGTRGRGVVASAAWSESSEKDPLVQMPQVANPGRGVHAPARFAETPDPHEKIPMLTGGGMDSHAAARSGAEDESTLHEKKPYTDVGGRGVHRLGLRDGEPTETREQVPLLTGRGMDSHASARSGESPEPSAGRFALGSSSSSGVLGLIARTRLYEEFRLLAARLRDVRVCCGDWKRVVTPAVTTGHGLTGVFLDPPYSTSERASGLYANDGGTEVSREVREWCVANGDNPLLRIVLAGYEGEHDMPKNWRVVEWKAQGGFGGQRRDGTNDNARRERLWLSPHCVEGQRSLFA